MNELVQQRRLDASDDSGTNVRKFLAKRGHLLMKESKDVSAIKTEHGGKIIIGTMIISLAKSATGDISFGVRLDHHGADGNDFTSSYIDFDEVEELVGALDYLANIAQRMLIERRDHTEVSYSTKDNIKFGFYQSQGYQQAFLDIGGFNNLIF